jgi:hypothetical protein
MLCTSKNTCEADSWISDAATTANIVILVHSNKPSFQTYTLYQSLVMGGGCTQTVVYVATIRHL